MKLVDSRFKSQVKLFKYLTLICGFLLVSCGKEEFTEGHSILEVAQQKPLGIQELVKSRLLFAKIVSIAFGNGEFRQYFKANFGISSKNGNYFEECLLIEHLDDKVLNDGTSFKDFLNSISDCEVSNIIGENIVEHVLSVDEMVTIKLPDVFLNYNWKIDETIPVVIATYPEEFSNANFIGYHYCNDSEFYQTGNIPQVFHVYIKHSEDNFLVDENNIANIIELLPQGNQCDELWSDVLNGSNVFKGKRIVNLKKAYKLWSEMCNFKGTYIDLNGCNEACQRNCSNPINNNIVMDHISVIDPIFYYAYTNLAFRESCTFYFQSQDLMQQLSFNDFALPNIRYSELGRSFKSIGHTNKLSKVPKMTIEEELHTNEIATPIKYLVTDVPNINLFYNLTLLQYGDLFYRKKYIDSNFPNRFDPENAILLGSSVLLDCMNSNTSSESGELKINFRY